MATPRLKSCRTTAHARCAGARSPASSAQDGHKAFCSEVCRRAAEKELRQAKSLLAHFEDLTAQLRIDIAAFGRGGLSPAIEPAEAEPATWQAAAAAVHRVSGVLAFVGENDDPLARELRALHAAVFPVIVARAN